MRRPYLGIVGRVDFDAFISCLHSWCGADSETFRLVGQAIDAAEVEFPYGLSPEFLARVADGIIDAVRDGERDVFRLRDAGLKGANVVLPSSRRNPLRRLSLFYSSCRQNPLPRLSVSYCQKQQLLSMAYDDHRPEVGDMRSKARVWIVSLTGLAIGTGAVIVAASNSDNKAASSSQPPSAALMTGSGAGASRPEELVRATGQSSGDVRHDTPRPGETQRLDTTQDRGRTERRGETRVRDSVTLTEEQVPEPSLRRFRG